MAKNKKQGMAVSGQKLKEMIEKKAYEFCQQRGCVPGNEWQDWFNAEKQVKEELKMAQ